MTPDIYEQSRVVQLRHYLVSAGFEFVPVERDHKRCVQRDWSKRVFAPDDFDARHASTGIKLGGNPGQVVAIDIDTGHEPHVTQILQIVTAVAPGATIRFRGNSSRSALLFRVALGGSCKRSINLVEVEPETDEWGTTKHPKFEVLTSGFLHVDGLRGGHRLHWILHDWTAGIPLVGQLPELSTAQVDEIIEKLIELGIVIQPASPPPLLAQTVSPPTRNLRVPPAPGNETFSIDLIESGLDALVKANASFGDEGFQNLVAGAINEARVNAPELVTRVGVLLAKKLMLLRKWQDSDKKRIVSFARRPMSATPKMMGSFVHEVEKHAPGWRHGVTGPQSVGVATGSTSPTTPSAFHKAPWTPNAPANWGQAMAVAKGADLMLWGILIRGKVTSVAAKGGIGKTHFAMLVMAHLAGDTDLMSLDDPAYPRQPESSLKVYGLFLEEELSLLGIKAKAITQHYGVKVDPARVNFCGMECGEGLRLWLDGTNGRPLVDEAGFLGIEELASTHDVVIIDALGLLLENSSGTNDSTVAAYTMKRLNKIASKHNCAILMVMHERKAKAGPDGRDADNATGAAQWISHGRGNYTLTEMDAKTAKNFGIDPDEAYRYLSAKSSKPNHAAKSGALWFKKVTIVIPGEKHTVMVLERWMPPVLTAKAAGLAISSQVVALRVIDTAERAGSPLSTASVPQAKHNGYPVFAIGEVAKALRTADPNLTIGYAEQTANAVILMLEKQGKIVRKSDSNRHKVWSVV